MKLKRTMIEERDRNRLSDRFNFPGEALTKNCGSLEDSSCKFDRATISPRSETNVALLRVPVLRLRDRFIAVSRLIVRSRVRPQHTGRNVSQNFYISRRKLFPISFIYFPALFLDTLFLLFFNVEAEVKI